MPLMIEINILHQALFTYNREVAITFTINQALNYQHSVLVVNLVLNQFRALNRILTIIIRPILIKIGQLHQELKI